MFANSRKLLERGRIHISKDEFFEARQLLSRLLLIEPDNEEALIEYAELICKDEPELTFKILQKLEKREEISLETLARVGILYHSIHQEYRAKAIYEKVLGLNESKAKTYQMFRALIKGYKMPYSQLNS